MYMHLRGLLINEVRSITRRNFHLSRCNFETHYDVLQIKRNCTQKDIKNAFIKLSKEYHPDMNTDVSTHSKFVKLNEAYSVLGRPETRRIYDLSLVPLPYTIRRPPGVHYENDFAPGEEYSKSFRDHSFWESRDRSKDDENMKKPYYGIRGLKKVSHSWIVSLLFLFTLIGVTLQVILINASVTFSRQAIEEESSRNENYLREVRERAKGEGNDAEVFARLQRTSDAFEAARKKNAENRRD